MDVLHSNSQMKDDIRTKSVFVGNIAYDATEEEIKALFSQVGPIISFKMVYDRETGKAKGFGFCEYADVETAKSAIRNLNGLEFKNRNLRVDCADNEKNAQINQSFSSKPPEIIEPLYVPHNQTASDLEETKVNEKFSSKETIFTYLSSMPPEKLFAILKDIKKSLYDNPVETKDMLYRNPQLSYAILQCLYMLNIIDLKAVNDAMDQTSNRGLKNLPPQESVPILPPNFSHPPSIDYRNSTNTHEENPTFHNETVNTSARRPPNPSTLYPPPKQVYSNYQQQDYYYEQGNKPPSKFAPPREEEVSPEDFAYNNMDISKNDYSGRRNNRYHEKRPEPVYAAQDRNKERMENYGKRMNDYYFDNTQTSHQYSNERKMPHSGPRSRFYRKEEPEFYNNGASEYKRYRWEPEDYYQSNYVSTHEGYPPSKIPKEENSYVQKSAVVSDPRIRSTTSSHGKNYRK